jgi:hypothetical protein
MSKKLKPESGAKPDLQIVLDKVLYDLLKAGKINQILTWKEQPKVRPSVISVTSPEQDEPVVVQCHHMDTVGFGYVPLGYPEKYKADRPTTRFHVAPAVQASSPEGEESTEGSESQTE